MENNSRRTPIASLALPFSLIMLLSSNLCAQSLQQRIREAAARFTADAQMTHAITSLTVLDAGTGKVVFSLNKDVGLAPASCQKTITAASAFFLLGQDFKYHTKLLYTGNIKEGVLHGDLIIRGSGDPMLGTWRYASTKMGVVLGEWIHAVRRAGISRIDGRILGDASRFDTQMPPDGWIWQDMGNYYGAGTCALTWHENQYDMHLLPGNHVGAPVKVTRIDPPVPGLHFINELTTGKPGSGDRTYIYAAPYTHLAYIRGTAPEGDQHFSVSGAVPDPALFCAHALEGALKGAGISVSKSASTFRLQSMDNKKIPSATKTIDDHVSPALDSIVHWFLHRSINLYGEQLLKTIALHEDATVCTDTGIAIEKRFWDKKGIDPAAVNIIDGSGLSPGNRVTSYAMASVLYQVRQQSWYSTYFDCLPVIHHIRMKSGHINDVCSYAGYLSTGAGKPLIFSFIVNNYHGPTREVQLKMFRLLDELKK